MKRLTPIIILLAVLLLSSCGQSKSISGTQTSVYATSERGTMDAYKIVIEMTQTVKALTPSPLPVPTKPISTKSPEQKVADCEKLNSGIRYVLTGDNVTSASLTLQNDQNGTEQGDYLIPYCRILTDFKDGDFLYISAQITAGKGELTCKIYDGKTLISQATASGTHSIATCSTNK